ncbi:MAG: TlpA family protein disulfide reductase [Armatimonadetes bacterium]|nr:TlpA family protein disulfide reductase [Armatimonadota bacterium]
MNALYKKYRDQGFVVLGLNNEEETKAALQFAKKSLSYPVLLHADGAFNDYGVQGIPATFILDATGKVVKRHIGFGPGMEKEFQKEIEALLEIVPPKS